MPQFADTFDHVVVLMMENRSFDNVFGFLYQDGVPQGQRFDGAVGQSSPTYDGKGEVFTSAGCGPHGPFPDPGEYIRHGMHQLFGGRFDGSNFNPPGAPDMSGFVRDYYQVLASLTEVAEPFTWPGDPALSSAAIMQCLAPETIPVLSTLAREFCVFDHWFCALPSVTWPNRAFWHADTSYGWADNPTGQPGWNIINWLVDSNAPTLFSRLDARFGERARSWRVYADQAIALTKLVHGGSLGDKDGPDFFRYLEYAEGGQPNFLTDCATGDLPSYAFLEPHFLNQVDHGKWHNDMHPSKWLSAPHWELWGPGGPGSVLLGDQLILKVYEALRTSPLRDRVLLIISFDEHGGCYDHVPPPLAAAPDPATFNGKSPEYGFDFQRLGPRVPIVMVSSHIASRTIINEPMNHASFLAGMQQKWDLQGLGPRQESSTSFVDFLTAAELRKWPDLSPLAIDEIEPNGNARDEIASTSGVLNNLQQLLVDGAQAYAELQRSL